MRQQRDHGEFKRGWKVIVAAMVGVGVGLSPMPFYTMGVFAPHLAQAFGWSIGDIMGALGITTLMVAWAGPLAGMLAVRFGVRPVAITSSVLFGIAFTALALSNGSLTRFYLTWAVISAVGAGTLPITWTRTVNNWFDVHKGLALGITLTGTGLFGIFSKPYLAWAIGAFGWQGGYVALGLLPLLLATPIAFLLLHEPAVRVQHLPVALSPGGLTMRETLRDWRFWLIAAAVLPISFALSGPLPNLEIILREGGLSVSDILRLTPLVGFSALSGRLIGGWLIDRFWAPAVGFVILALPGIACWMLTADTLDVTSAAISIVLLGFALGVEYDLIAFFVARYFGLRSYAAIYGALYVSFSFGAGLGPLWFGRAYDQSGSYVFALKASLVMLVGAAAALLLLGRYRTFADQPVIGAAPVDAPLPHPHDPQRTAR